MGSEGWTLKAGEMGEVASTARSGGVTNRRRSKGGSPRRAEGMLAREHIEQEKKLPGERRGKPGVTSMKDRDEVKRGFDF